MDCGSSRPLLGLYKLDLFKIRNEEGVRVWASLIKTMEDALILYHHTPGSLTQDYEYLQKRTGGSIASLSALIRESAIRAVITGTEAITRPVMESVVLDRRATRGYETVRMKSRWPGSP
jgi:hypothetical protein